MNDLLPKLRSTALVAAITVVLLEIALHVFYRISVGGFLYERMAIPIYVPDPHRCYAVAPNLEYVHHTHEYEVVYRTDEHSFRVSGKKSLAEDYKAEDRLRVLMLGPSFAFGWANDYEDSFAARITRRLDGSERPAELLNLGTPGQQIGRQLCWAQNQAAQFRPDLIIQTVYGWLGSIATSCDDSACPMVVDGFLLNPHANWRQRLSENSKRSAIVFYSWYLMRRIQIAAFPDARTEPPTRVATTDLGSIAELERRYRSYLAFMHGALGPDVPVVLVFIPYAYAIRPSDSPRWGIDNRAIGLSVRLQQQSAARTLREAGIPIVDPTDALVAADARDRMYFLVDVHLTPAGNAVVAAEVLRFLKDQTSVPVAPVGDDLQRFIAPGNAKRAERDAVP